MKIGFTCGAFDLLHAGHIMMLRECASQCEYLVVGLHTDPSVERSYKNKPIQSAYERQLQLEGCKFVDKVIMYDTEKDLIDILSNEDINVRFVGEEYKDTEITGQKICQDRNIEIVYNTRRHNFSSSELIQRIKDRQNNFLYRNPYLTYLYHLGNMITFAKPGLMLEFGVYKGHSTKVLAKNTKNKIYGFDSFNGLPEDWQGKFEKGSLACDIPTDLPDNVELVIGYFEDTLEEFLKTHTDPITFVHIDCDLYSSTKYILDTCHDRFADQCIICFDDYNNFNGYEEHQFRAFKEYREEHEVYNSFIYQYGLHQVAFRIIKNEQKHIDGISLSKDRDQFELINL